MTILEIQIPGEPVAKQRPRMGRNKKFYTPDATTKAEELIALYARQAQIKFFKRFSNPPETSIFLIITYFCRKRRSDIDNLIKTTMDGLQKGGIYKNDNQVNKLNVERVYIQKDEEPMTNVCVIELG